MLHGLEDGEQETPTVFGQEPRGRYKLTKPDNWLRDKLGQHSKKKNLHNVKAPWNSNGVYTVAGITYRKNADKDLTNKEPPNTKIAGVKWMVRLDDPSQTVPQGGSTSSNPDLANGYLYHPGQYQSRFKSAKQSRMGPPGWKYHVPYPWQQQQADREVYPGSTDTVEGTTLDNNRYSPQLLDGSLQPFHNLFGTNLGHQASANDIFQGYPEPLFRSGDPREQSLLLSQLTRAEPYMQTLPLNFKSSGDSSGKQQKVYYEPLGPAVMSSGNRGLLLEGIDPNSLSLNLDELEPAFQEALQTQLFSVSSPVREESQQYHSGSTQHHSSNPTEPTTAGYRQNQNYNAPYNKGYLREAGSPNGTPTEVHVHVRPQSASPRSQEVLLPHLQPSNRWLPSSSLNPRGLIAGSGPLGIPSFTGMRSPNMRPDTSNMVSNKQPYLPAMGRMIHSFVGRSNPRLATNEGRHRGKRSVDSTQYNDQYDHAPAHEPRIYMEDYTNAWTGRSNSGAPPQEHANNPWQGSSNTGLQSSPRPGGMRPNSGLGPQPMHGLYGPIVPTAKAAPSMGGTDRGQNSGPGFSHPQPPHPSPRSYTPASQEHGLFGQGMSINPEHPSSPQSYSGSPPPGSADNPGENPGYMDPLLSIQDIISQLGMEAGKAEMANSGYSDPYSSQEPPYQSSGTPGYAPPAPPPARPEKPRSSITGKSSYAMPTGMPSGYGMMSYGDMSSGYGGVSMMGHNSGSSSSGYAPMTGGYGSSGSSMTSYGASMPGHKGMSGYGGSGGSSGGYGGSSSGYGSSSSGYGGSSGSSSGYGGSSGGGGYGSSSGGHGKSYGKTKTRTWNTGTYDKGQGINGKSGQIGSYLVGNWRGAKKTNNKEQTMKKGSVYKTYTYGGEGWYKEETHGEDGGTGGGVDEQSGQYGHYNKKMNQEHATPYHMYNSGQNGFYKEHGY